MCCGLTNASLMVRVGPDHYEEALAQPHARPMDFTGRPLAGMVYVDQKGYESDEALETWVQRGVDFTSAPTDKSSTTPQGRPARGWGASVGTVGWQRLGTRATARRAPLRPLVNSQ
jgi:hypothetical protein